MFILFISTGKYIYVHNK